MPKSKLKRLVRDRDDFYWRNIQVVADKRREIACPIAAMRNTHDRLKNLLNRIEQPAYMFSPRKKRSSWQNAQIHQLQKRLLKLDIRQFYPSTTDEHVFRFLFYEMQMKADVAGILTKLCTVDGHLAFGSPVSPILCSLVHRDMFDAINSYCVIEGHTMSVWVDDIAISGEDISSALVAWVKAAIKSKGLNYHKVKKLSLEKGAVITGTHVSHRRLSPSNRTHQKIRDKIMELQTSNDNDQRLRSILSLVGYANHAIAVCGEDSLESSRLRKRLQWLHNERRRLELEVEQVPPQSPRVSDIKEKLEVPW